MFSDNIDLANELASREIEHLLRARANAAAKAAAESGPAVAECQDCDDELPAVRVQMRATRCVSCQECADKRDRMFAKR
jgi:RNA polymerase-binding transcription factor DksA